MATVFNQGSKVPPGFRVEFKAAGDSHNWFYTYVWHEDYLVAEKAVCRSYPKASRWALKQIKNYKKGLDVLGVPNG